MASLSLNGANLTLATLALIADMLERSGDVVVRNCEVRSDAPIARMLGFEVIREESDGYIHTRVEHRDTNVKYTEFWTPTDAIGR